MIHTNECNRATWDHSTHGTPWYTLAHAYALQRSASSCLLVEATAGAVRVFADMTGELVHGVRQAALISTRHACVTD